MNEEQPKMIIRVSRESLAFAIEEKGSATQIAFSPYGVKAGMSIPANLRDALRTDAVLQREASGVRVLVDSPVLLVPIEEYEKANRELFYRHSFPDAVGCSVEENVLPDLHAVALFAVNRDLRLVIDDHYQQANYICLMRPMWNYMHRRSFIDTRRKLYAYFHDGRVDIFSFERNRFVFSNSYDTRHMKDAVYFILFVWKQLALDQTRDELFLAGQLPEADELTATLKKYIAIVGIINASAEFNRAPLTRIKGIPFDLAAYYLG